MGVEMNLANRATTRDQNGRLAATTLLSAITAALVACGGGGNGIQFPEPQAASPDAAQQRKATAMQAIEVTQSLRQAVTQAVVSGQPLTTVQTAVQTTVDAQTMALPSGGSITEVRVEYGGTIVAEVNLPALPPAPASTEPVPTPVGTNPPPVSGPQVTPPAGTIETALAPNIAGRGQLVWVAYQAAEGVVRWYCFGSYASVAKDTDGACLYPGDSARGMTWGTGNGPATARDSPPYDAAFNLSYVSCDVITPPTLGRIGKFKACDPTYGDWHVLRKLPLLCVRIDNRDPPVGWIRPIGTRSFVGGEMAVTPPVYGIQLLGRVPANALCQQQFGTGWRMASFNDGGGFAFWGVGRTPIDQRFWVLIGGNSGNPWCATLTGLPCNEGGGGVDSAPVRPVSCTTSTSTSTGLACKGN
jgi:hypothetical protein